MTAPATPARAPLAASEEPARLCLLPGLESPSGAPVVGVAAGHPRRQTVRAFASFGAALADMAGRGGGRSAPRGGAA